MDLTFNVLESIRRDIRELRDDLTIEKDSRIKSCEDLKKELKEVRRCPPPVPRAELPAAAVPMNGPCDPYRGCIPLFAAHYDGLQRCPLSQGRSGGRA